jgi:hypothetical protein
MKRIAFNIALVIAGLSVLGGAFLSIASFHPVSAPDFDSKMRVASVILFVGSLVLFAGVWRFRARWLSSHGVFQSFAAFSAFLSEGHRLPSPSEEIVREYRSWLEEHGSHLTAANEFDPYEAGKNVFDLVEDAGLRRRLLLGLFGHFQALRTFENA